MRPQIVIVALLAALLGAIITGGIISAVDGDRSSPQTTRIGRLTEMEQSGEMHEVLEQHRQMLQQMQDDASPAMVKLMNKDPMWQMMRSDDWARMDEQHQADIDRMLGEDRP